MGIDRYHAEAKADAFVSEMFPHKGGIQLWQSINGSGFVSREEFKRQLALKFYVSDRIKWRVEQLVKGAL